MGHDQNSWLPMIAASIAMAIRRKLCGMPARGRYIYRVRPNPTLFRYAPRASLLASVACGWVVGLCSIGVAWELARSLDGQFLEGWTAELLGKGLLAALGFACLRFAFASLQAWFAGHVAACAKTNIRGSMLGQSTQGVDPSGFLTRWLQGVESTDAWFAQYLPQLFLALLVPLSILAVALSRDILSGMVLLVTAPLLPLFLAMIGKDAEARTKAQWRQLTQQGSLYLETLLGLRTLRQLGISREWLGTLADGARNLRETTLGVLKVAFLSAFVLELVGTLGTAILSVQVGLRLLHGHLEFRDAIFLLLLAPEFYGPLRLLGLRTHAAMEAEPMAQELSSQTINTKHPRPIAHKCPYVSLNGSMSSNDNKRHLSTTVIASKCSFRHPGQLHPTLQDVHFCVNAGERIVVAGESGSGKSSLLGALLGLVPIESGSLELMGAPRIAWIPQNPCLFPRSLRDNLWMHPHPDHARDAELMLALSKVGLAEFVRNLPQGLDTRIGESHSRLSGGQARRIALARAFVTQADLVLMDEPEAHLDRVAIRQLEATVTGMESCTRIIVSHHPQTLAQADRVLYLADGTMRGIAPHAELLASFPEYRALLSGGEA